MRMPWSEGGSCYRAMESPGVVYCHDALQRLNTAHRGHYKVAWRWYPYRKAPVAVGIGCE
jgi:hypothetical protein